MPDVCLSFVLLFTSFIIVVTQKLVLQQSKNVTAKYTETLSPPPSIQFSLILAISFKLVIEKKTLGGWDQEITAPATDDKLKFFVRIYFFIWQVKRPYNYLRTEPFLSFKRILMTTFMQYIMYCMYYVYMHFLIEKCASNYTAFLNQRYLWAIR